MAETGGRPRLEIPDSIRQAVIELHAQEVGKNEIQRRLKEHGLTRHMLDRISKEEDLQWNRKRTEKAVENLKIQAKGRRALMAERYLKKAADFLELTEQPYEMALLSNKTGKWETYIRDTPPSAETLGFVKSSQIAMREHRDLVAFDQADQTEESKSLLDSLQGALDTYTKNNKQTEEEMPPEDEN